MWPYAFTGGPKKYYWLVKKINQGLEKENEKKNICLGGISMKNNIFMISDSEFIGGAYTIVNELTKKINQHSKFNATIFAPPDGKYLNKSKKIIFSKIKKHDILHVHFFSLSNFLPILFCHSKKILSIHRHFFANVPYSGSFTPIKKLVNFFIEFFLLNSSVLIFDKIILVSESQRKSLLKGIIFKNSFKNKVKIFSNFIDEKLILNKKRIGGELNVLFVGRLTPSKGYLDFLEVVNKEILNKVLFSIVGKNSKRYTLPNKNNLKYLGEISHENIFKIYDNNTILLFPSYSETCGLVVLEAMARGLVVIASDLPDIKEYFVSNRNGFLFKPGDINKIEETIVYLIKNPKVVERISKNNLKDILKFTSKKQIPKYIKIYEELLNESNKIQLF